MTVNDCFHCTDASIDMGLGTLHGTMHETLGHPILSKNNIGTFGILNVPMDIRWQCWTCVVQTLEEKEIETLPHHMHTSLAYSPHHTHFAPT